MRSKLIFTVIALSLGTVSIASAQTFSANDVNYFTISKVETHEIPVTNAADFTSVSPVVTSSPAPAPGGITIGGVNIDDIINLGKTLWNIVESNKPVVNVNVDTANALPRGVSQWQDLAGWQAPDVRAFESDFKNLYGMTVIRFQYRLSYTPMGNYQGVGQYLTNVTVVPQELYVAWGYTFNATVKIPNITNAGTYQNPLAAAEIQVKWAVDTVMTHNEQSAGYYVRGDGLFKPLQ